MSTKPSSSVSSGAGATLAVGGATITLGTDRTIAIAHRGRRVAQARARATIEIDGQRHEVALAAGPTTVDTIAGRERAVVRAEHDGFASEWWISADPGDQALEIGAAIIGRGLEG